MRDAALALLAAITAAQTTNDRNAAIAALLQLLDTGLSATVAWMPPPAVTTPVVVATSAQKFDSGGQVPVPVAASAFFQETCFVTSLEITNQGSLDATVSVWDGNGDFLIPQRTLPTGELLTYKSDGRRMVGGIFWQASVLGCKAYVRWQNAF